MSQTNRVIATGTKRLDLMTENKPNEVHNLKNQVMKIVPDFPGLNR
jgi:hypothetical protein